MVCENRCVSSPLRKQVEHVYTLTDRFQVQLRVLDESHATLEQRVRFDGNADVDDLVMLVMIEASKSAQDDLKDLLEQAQAINQAKAKLRHQGRLQKTSLDVDSVLQLMLDGLREDDPSRAGRDPA